MGNNIQKKKLKDLQIDSFHLMDIFIVFSGLAHSSIHQLGHTESLVVCLPLLLSYYVFTRS